MLLCLLPWSRFGSELVVRALCDPVLLLLRTAALRGGEIHGQVLMDEVKEALSSKLGI